MGLAWKCQMKGKGALFSAAVCCQGHECAIKCITLQLSSVVKKLPHNLINCVLYKINV